MNWYRVIGTVLIGSLSLNLFGQTSLPFSKSSYILPYRLEVTFNKTINLVFPAAITSIDRGSQDIMVEKAAGVDNILRVKADTKVFEETNLSVITNDGKLYSFLVSYNSNPSYLNINIGDVALSTMTSSKPKDGGITPSMTMNEQSLKEYSQKAVSQKSNIHSVYGESSRMAFALTGFYVKDNAMFCRLRINNYSRINYDIDQFRLYIRDKKQSKRTATQEIEINPLYILGDSSSIRGKGEETLVIAVPKFTIPDGKYMAIEITERNGGRHLNLRVKNRHVMRAMLLNF
ncbi:MAG: conjugative transposon protein TraN [Sphingobacteriales bacterium]|nr:MAG: conjugative transposon protein TraN [Sphingobacteriales bacterium]